MNLLLFIFALPSLVKTLGISLIILVQMISKALYVLKY